ncbi:hypothetical protein CANINC_002456 [Pichia inconspicua]|uniref:Zn(2)-C6 fungal-type domain-containing protein n=1 Tax=Pichia inconspicua TaxID=52247 RepID=A0A4T0X1I3_9ASCO|nr:hypothetical protein CANINC_002456 [[Candida] inconspicua]
MPIRRTKTGCIPCRLSRRKCDEAKPTCQRCSNQNKNCTWPSSPNQSLTQILAADSVSDYNFSTTKFKRVRTGFPSHSIQVISDLTLKTCQHEGFEKILKYISAAHLTNIDNSKSIIIESLHSSALSSVLKTELNSVTLELRLSTYLFSILGMTFIGLDNDKLLKYVYLSLDLILKHNLTPVSTTYNLLLESFIYNYSISVIITPPEILKKYDPFFVCKILEQLVPSDWNTDETPFLNISVDIFLIAAKVSSLFKTKSIDFSKHQMLLVKLEEVCHRQPCVVQLSTQSERIFVPQSRANYLMIAACKILLWYLLPQNNDEKINTLIEETINYLKISTNLKKDETLFALWGIFIIGIQLKREEHKEFLNAMLFAVWEERKNTGWLNAMNKLHIVWNKNLDLEVLHSKEFLSNMWFN